MRISVIYLYHQRGKENPPNQRGRKNMKTVEMMKWNKGYYVTVRIGCNARREWVKTKKAAEALMKKWQKGE